MEATLVQGATGTGKTSTLLYPMCARDIEKKYFFMETAKKIGFEALQKGLAYVNVPLSNEEINNTFTLDYLTPIKGKENEYNSLIKDLITYATSIVAKNRLAIDGIYSHMMFDLSYSLTDGKINNVLGINRFGLIEAYSPDVCRKYAKEIKAIETNRSLSEEDKEIQLQELLSAVVVKFPSAMPDEYETVVYLIDK
jgi:hypothetical protein